MQGSSSQSAISSKHPKQALDGHSAGNLTDWPARKIFDHLHNERFTGQLLLTHRERRKKVLFWRGEIIRIHSNLVPELFGRLMVDRGWIHEEELQKLLGAQKTKQKRLGDLVEELHGVTRLELEDLYKTQKIHSLLQAVSWEEGAYEIHMLDLKGGEDPLFSYRDVAVSIEGLFDMTSNRLGPLFQYIRPWQPKSSSVDLGETPLWSILAGCRMAGVNGILSIRKQNKLYEIVLKFGIPMILYEGTFGQPRQTIVVRQASAEHESFFLDQIFRLFSFLSGSAHFRLLSDMSDTREERQPPPQIREDTNVTRNLRADEIPFELSSHLLIEKRGFLTRLKDKLIHILRKPDTKN